MKKWTPDYANMEDTNRLDNVLSFTSPGNGWVSIQLNSFAFESWELKVTVRGKTVLDNAAELKQTNSAVPNALTAFIPVSTGDTIAVTDAPYNWKRAFFVPGKWV